MPNLCEFWTKYIVEQLEEVVEQLPVPHHVALAARAGSQRQLLLFLQFSVCNWRILAVTARHACMKSVTAWQYTLKSSLDKGEHTFSPRRRVEGL